MTCERLQVRYIFVFIGFLATFNLYSLRLNLSIAIVDMVDFDNRAHPINDSVIWDILPSSAVPNNATSLSEGTSKENESTSHRNKKFDWNGSQQGLLLSAYFYGYTVTQVAGAYLGRRFGRVRVLGACVIGSSTVTILFPLIASKLGFVCAVAARVLTGIFSGVTMPILFATTSFWAPVSERSKLLSIQFAGIPTGSCIVLPVAGILAGHFGWESVFYVTGVVGIIWALLWLSLVYETPEKHPRISSRERMYIMRSTARNDIESEKKRRVPWISILTSKAWACLAFTHFSSLFGKYQLMTMLPSYLKSLLHFDVKSGGYLSSIPFVLNTMLLFIIGPLADFLIARNIKSIYVRKILTTTGLLASCVSIIVVTYIGSNVPGAMALFTVAVAMDALVVPGFKACIMEITPEFSGIAYGLSNTVSSLSGLIAPQITGTLREQFKEDPITGWRASFWIGGTIYFLGAMVFLIFGTNKKQPWSYDETKAASDEELKPL